MNNNPYPKYVRNTVAVPVQKPAKDAAQHWHDRYRAKCQELHDERARLGAQIEALEQQPAAAIPEGWKLVPETPTNEMTSSMADALEDPENERSNWDLAENMYRAMLAAAPEH